MRLTGCARVEERASGLMVLKSPISEPADQREAAEPCEVPGESPPLARREQQARKPGRSRRCGAGVLAYEILGFLREFIGGPHARGLGDRLIDPYADAAGPLVDLTGRVGQAPSGLPEHLPGRGSESGLTHVFQRLTDKPTHILRALRPLRSALRRTAHQGVKQPSGVDHGLSSSPEPVLKDTTRFGPSRFMALRRRLKCKMPGAEPGICLKHACGSLYCTRRGPPMAGFSFSPRIPRRRATSE